MNIINLVLGKPLGWVMYGCYELVRNYGLTILLFTLISKVIMFPVALMLQKNSIKMVKLQPEMRKLQRIYAADKDRLNEEQFKLYEREGYNPAMGCLPTLLQVIIVLGLIQVVYHPLEHLFHLDAETITALLEQVGNLLGLSLHDNSAQLRVIEAIQNITTSETVKALGLIAEDMFDKIRGLDMNFLGLDLALTPSIRQPGAIWIIPMASGFSSLLLCILQNRDNVLQREQNKWSQWGMSAIVVAFGFYFAYLVPAGIGLYWAFSNLLAIGQIYLLNWIIDPRKYIDYSERDALTHMDKTSEKKSDAEIARENELRRREQQDEERFYETENKLLVFYSERSAFYNYFSEIIDYITAHSHIGIHYITGDPDDAVFSKNIPNLVPYYISDSRLGNVFASMDAEIVVMTVPDLQTFHVKRSVVRKDIEYIFVFHGLVSTIMSDRKGAYDHFDTVFCAAPYHKQEIRETEAMYKLKPKTLLEHGYGLLDKLLRDHEELKKTEQHHERPVILIAPSYQPGNILDSCLDDLLNSLRGNGWHIIVRAHPQFIKHEPERMKQITERYADWDTEELEFETTFTSHASIYSADLLITDWSGTCFEYCYVTKRPALFIDTPMKVINFEYTKYSKEPIEITFRSVGGQSIAPEKANQAAEAVQSLLDHADDYREAITDFMERNLYNIGHSGEKGGKYILNAIVKRHRKG